MVKYIIRYNWMNYAHIKHTNEPYNKTSILKDGSGQIAGTLGELAFGRWLNDLEIDFEYIADDSKDCDFIVGGYRVDVKTKKTFGEPRDDYTVRIPKTQQNQECDIYIFAYATDHAVYMLGYSSKYDFWDTIGHSVKAGDQTDNFIEKVDATYARISDLTEMERLEIIFSRL